MTNPKRGGNAKDKYKRQPSGCLLYFCPFSKSPVTDLKINCLFYIGDYILDILEPG